MDTELERPRWRTTLHYRVHPRFQIGVEFNPDAGEFTPLANLFLFREGPGRPAVILGTSSDRIGSPEGYQAYYATIAKHHPSWPVSAYFSVNWSEWDNGFNFPAGLVWELGNGFALQPMWDGDEMHLLLHWQKGRWTVSPMWVWMEAAGIAVSVEF